MRGTADSYRVFVRNWWRWDRAPFSGARVRVPDPGARKTTLATHCTYDEARAMCEQYAQTHKPGPLSRKAEFERED
jgi:hypothetical protein